MARTAIQVHGTNLAHLLDDLSEGGVLTFDQTYAVLRGAVRRLGAQPSWPDKPEKPSKKPAPKPAPVVERAVAGASR